MEVSSVQKSNKFSGNVLHLIPHRLEKKKKTFKLSWISRIFGEGEKKSENVKNWIRKRWLPGER